MEKEKYSPLEIHGQAWRNVFIPEEGLQPSEVEVMIERQGKKPYVILTNKEKGNIIAGEYTGVAVRIDQDGKKLYRDKDLLGKVTVRYRGKKKEWGSFDDFWK